MKGLENCGVRINRSVRVAVADLPNKICRLRNLANPVFPGLGTETYWIQLMAQFNCSKIVVNVSNESVKTNGVNSLPHF